LIFGKHINRYYAKYALWLLVGLASLVMVDFLQLEIPKLYRMVIDGMSYGYVVRDGAQAAFDMDLVLDGRRYGFEYFAESAFPITHYSLLRVPLQAQKDTCVSMYTSKLRACGPWIERFLNKWKELD